LRNTTFAYLKNSIFKSPLTLLSYKYQTITVVILDQVAPWTILGSYIPRYCHLNISIQSYHHQNVSRRSQPHHTIMRPPLVPPPHTMHSQFLSLKLPRQTSHRRLGNQMRLLPLLRRLGPQHQRVHGPRGIDSTSSGGYGDNSDLKFRSTPIGIPLSRQPSLTASVSGARRVSRSGSFAGSDINISPYDAGPVLGALEKNQQMNARIHGYIDELPELSSDGKRSKSKFRKSRAVEREQEEQNNEQQENESPAWKRRSKSIISLVRRR